MLFVKKVVYKIYSISRVPEYPVSYNKLAKLSNDELLSIMRHESHRLEKSFYNNRDTANERKYLNIKKRLSNIYKIFDKRSFSKCSTIDWSKEIYFSFNNIYEGFIKPNLKKPKRYELAKGDRLIDLFHIRRSIRVWKDDQPGNEELKKLAMKMIEGAVEAPNSDNRQAWRFLMLLGKKDKDLLNGLKEKQCVDAPLVIFVGMDERSYGFSNYKSLIYIDAGAAIMQMLLVAHECGFGAFWNHFGYDFIKSRKKNRKIFHDFRKKKGLPDYILPVAILAVGVPKYIPPKPRRMDVDSYIIKGK